ncbi:DegV family protein [Lactobacillus acidophilus]|uniref:DegV family protein n=1 Tax=Lactobacillus acidophilus TaxID=1579 RepID=UPI000354F1CE|nr:DegV family protein [Lactobacillus acidophilus]MBN3483262.1 DegV family protein [Lactobacillus acidophilus]MCT3626910.1 DegV family protein [Lactobacillus acidophilus]UEX76087.1 DegV family protein [Lactobacillus acidophilus]UIP48609.1 DegV family protein [Lactobacillus acidophilus]UTX30791.1 DegV family protein [Lactobacillus acidophilus]
MKIALVTDSTSVLTEQEVKDNNINVVPIPVIVGDKEYLEGVNITSEQLFEMQRQGAAFPKTSQPSMGQMLELFNKLHDEGYEAIIAITLYSGISGFYQNLVNMAHNNPEYNLYPYDSKMTVKLQGYLVLAAAKMIKKGLEPEAIINNLDKIRDTIQELFVVDDLKNLSRGGRLSNASAFIGTMLQIKPILTFNDEGKIVAFDKIRSMKRAVSKVEKLALEKTAELPYRDKLRLFVFHSNDHKQAEEIKQFINENFPNKPVDIAEFSPVIATHLGEKSIAIAWMIDIDKLDFSK